MWRVIWLVLLVGLLVLSQYLPMVTPGDARAYAEAEFLALMNNPPANLRACAEKQYRRPDAPDVLAPDGHALGRLTYVFWYRPDATKASASSCPALRIAVDKQGQTSWQVLP